MKTTVLYKAIKILTVLVLGASSVAMAQVRQKTDLYSRSWNTFTAATEKYDADSVIWTFYSYSTYRADTSIADVYTISSSGLISLTLYASGAVYSKSYNVEHVSSLGRGTNITNPFTDSLVVSADGLQLSAFSFLNVDSIAWKVRNDITRDSTYVLYTGSGANTTITVTQNATVTVWLRSEGLWYQQLIQFNGISQNPISGAIQAPVIPSATYTWYFEDAVLPVSGASFVPTQNGTYRVVITWIGPSNARLADGANRAEFLFEVTNVMSTDLHSSSLSTTSLTLYPNPASESLTISNVSGEYVYSIKNAIGNVVAKGQAVGNSELNISHLNSGLYVVTIQTASVKVTKKLMIK